MNYSLGQNGIGMRDCKRIEDVYTGEFSTHSISVCPLLCVYNHHSIQVAVCALHRLATLSPSFSE